MANAIGLLKDLTSWLDDGVERFYGTVHLTHKEYTVEVSYDLDSAEIVKIVRVVGDEVRDVETLDEYFDMNTFLNMFLELITTAHILHSRREYKKRYYLNKNKDGKNN